MAVTQLGYLGIGVSDVDAWEIYASDVLGLEVGGKEEDGSLRLRMDQHLYRFMIHPSGEDDLLYAGWEVKDQAALTDIAERVRTAGISVAEGTPADLEARKVIGMVKFDDPAGLATEIFFGPSLEKTRPFNSPRAISGFETGENGAMGLGHIVVSMPDLEEGINFYRDVLGLRISDYIDLNFGGMKIRAAFFHCNPRHHSIAFFGPLAAPPAEAAPPPGIGPGKRLNHFMIQAKTLNEVGLTHKLCEEQGMEMGNLGVHTNDEMFSFYMETPSGFNVEFGWGGREVDDDVWQVQYYQDASIWGHENIPMTAAVAGD